MSSANILWTDDIQNGSTPFGFDGFGVEHPIGTAVEPNDANNVNLSRAPDPAGGAGFALRHFATFDEGGSRAQAGIWSFVNSTFEAQAKSKEGVWVAQQWYFPEALSAGSHDYPWINLWDWHSTAQGGAERWDTSPGLMLAKDGSMTVQWVWGSEAFNINQPTAWSSIALPVGAWFDIEMHYVWSENKDATITLWINGQEALKQSGVQTRKSSHTNIEMYCKFYGSDQGTTDWSPTPSLKFTRNVRISNGRIWR